jgi:hypothetical protein
MLSRYYLDYLVTRDRETYIANLKTLKLPDQINQKEVEMRSTAILGKTASVDT